MKNPILKIDNLESYYGPIMAIRGVSLVVNEGQIVTVLGANGAGKTTLLKTISQFVPSNEPVESRMEPISIRHDQCFLKVLDLGPNFSPKIFRQIIGITIFILLLINHGIV